MSHTVQRRTPGVYVTELSAFPPSIVGIETAVPAFVGYTETAVVSGKQVYNKPIKITCLADYTAVFGGGFKPQYKLATVTPPTAWDFQVLQTDGTYLYFSLTQQGDSEFNLYNSLRLFYANGGGTAYVVSVGDYTDNGNTPDGVSVDATKLNEGLTAVQDQVGPTMLVVPDAVLVAKEADFFTVTTKMLAQCAKMQDRVAILDVWGTKDLTNPIKQVDLDARITAFRAGIGNLHLNYGMAYFPFLTTTVVQPTDVDYTWLMVGDDSQFDLLKNSILLPQAESLYKDTTAVMAEVDKMHTTLPPPQGTSTVAEVASLDQNLVNALPILGQIEDILCDKNNVLPSSGAMAGIYTLNDSSRGVWNAPANMTVASVVAPSILLNNDQQADLNVPLDGKAVNAIRNFVGRGNLVWGARTLDGNSNDYRYIQVRRTLVYIEQSVKFSLNQFVFAPNDGNTWVNVTSMISNFLSNLWSQGGLMGATAQEAFSVQCGLGSTMTPQDILEGYMVVQITLQMIHPAEFIELTFKQKMGGAG